MYIVVTFAPLILRPPELGNVFWLFHIKAGVVISVFPLCSKPILLWDAFCDANSETVFCKHFSFAN